MYKRKWGTHIHTSSVIRGDILIKPIRFTKAIQSVFAHNFFIVRQGRSLSGKILYKNGELGLSKLKKLTSRFFTPGLTKLNIYCLNPIEKDTLHWAQAQKINIKLIDLTPHSDLARAYCVL
jgi:hypothetical protein